MLFLSPGSSLNKPNPAIKYIPPESAIESVQPGTGSSNDAPIIDGLKISSGIRLTLL